MPASRHVVIYGPPAAGKLTVARCLAARCGLKVLDNHLTADAAARLFDFGSEPFADLVHRLRHEFNQAAAHAGVNVVSTFVYGHPVDRWYVDRLVATVEAEGGTVTFAQLLPPPAVLEERVVQPSRAEVRKLRGVAELRRILERYDLRTPISPDDLSIDNTDLPPDEVAAIIAAHAGLDGEV